MTCTLCPSPVYAKGWCTRHYARARRTGRPEVDTRAERTDPGVRFWPKVRKTRTCWLWTGALTSSGYGSFKMVPGESPLSAHVAAWLLSGNPPVPAGHELDHTCHVHACVRPAHLVVALLAGNRGQHNRDKAACPQGHEYDDANTYVTPRGTRQCRACMREAQRRYRLRRAPALPSA